MFFFPIPLWPCSLARSGGGPWPFWTTTMTFGRSFLRDLRDHGNKFPPVEWEKYGKNGKVWVDMDKYMGL